MLVDVLCGACRLSFDTMKITAKNFATETARATSPVYWLALMLAFAVTGCVTRSTVQSRVQEQQSAFQALSPEVQQLVMQGRIQAGMSTNAVYMAWGKPDEVLESGDAHGNYTTWVYRGAFLEETRYWVGRRIPYLAHDYEPRSYVRAEIVFFNGKVKSWRTLPQPNY